MVMLNRNKIGAAIWSSVLCLRGTGMTSEYDRRKPILNEQ